MNETVLVVDDNVVNSRLAAFALKKGGYNAIELDSGLKLLDYLKDNLPDLILLDVEMPDMDGFEVMDVIQEDDRLRDIPVIFMTGNSDRDTEVNCFVKGAQDFISKPFAADVVIQRANRTLELKRLKSSMQAEVDRQMLTASEKIKEVIKEELGRCAGAQIDSLVVQNVIDSIEKAIQLHG